MSDMNSEGEFDENEQEELDTDPAFEEADTEEGEPTVTEIVIVPETDDFSPAISALPPKLIKHEEDQVEVSASPAFQCLDELFHDGKLTGTKVAFLKAKYTELHEYLKSTRDNESRLLKQAKDCANELEQQTVELEKADNFPESSNTEVSKLREQLLKYNNDLAQIEEREYQLEYKIETLEEEKKIVEREHARLPKAGEIEKKIKELQSGIEDLKREIGQRQNESKTLKEDLESTQRLTSNDKKEFEKVIEELEKLKSELVQINTQPGQITKEADKIARQKNALAAKLESLNGEYDELMESFKTLEAQRKVLEEEKIKADRELDDERRALDNTERELEKKMDKFKEEKEREVSLLGDKNTLDMNLRHISLEKKTQHDFHSRKTREIDRDQRNLKKIELQLKVAEENLNHTHSIHEKIKSQVAALPKDDGSANKKREELQKEVEQTKRALAQQNSLTAVEHVKLEASAAEEQNLLYEQSDLRIEVVELTRLAAIKADEREQKARDFMRAEMKYHRAVEDLKTKQLQIQDHEKKNQEMQIKLKDFAKHYDIIKNERNKCVNLIQTSTQKSAEMREKIKILHNEIEILRTAVMQIDKKLQKQRLKHMNSIVQRDSLRNEEAKQHRLELENKEKRDQQKMDISKLNLMINQGEEQMVQLRKRYERNVQHRNDRGIKLIERNEEVCVFYEKVNIQDQMIRNGEVELKAREEEIRFLNLQNQEEERTVQLTRKSMPNKVNLERELVTLQIQLQQCQDRMLELEKDLENPYDETRVRHLTGKDPSPGEVQGKVEELESRLAEKEEQLLEKDLIYEQVERLVGRIRHKAEVGKDDTLSLAKSVNRVQTKIKDTTRKMMAVVSELSMNQAMAMKLQQEVKERELFLEQCYLRMEKGEAPAPEMEIEWQRMIRDSIRRLEEMEERKMMEEEEEQFKTAGGIYTTAEPRPNAYIPDDDSELPIPRPYGSHAPYKPSEYGSTMRHIRKPVPKPIEI